MDYNTIREKLIIPEYGRNVQKMVNYCVSIEDRDERNDTALAIIEVMGNLNPHLRDVPDFKHKLWDQLFIMSKFKIDVDSPYPIPSEEFFTEKPEMLVYPEKSRKYRFYGLNLKKMIAVAISREDFEEKELLIMALANHMKKSFLNWNKDTVDDETILKHLYELSDGNIDLRNQQISLRSEFNNKKNYSNDSKTRQTNYKTNNYSNNNNRK